jgi:hypothetical protein
MAWVQTEFSRLRRFHERFPWVSRLISTSAFTSQSSGHQVIYTIYGCDYRRGMNWWIDLLTTYTHNSKVKVNTALSLISTLYKSSQHPLSLFAACCIFITRSLSTSSNIGDPTASRAHALSLQPPVQNLTLNWQWTPNCVSPVVL